jgi:hypothetical protein
MRRVLARALGVLLGGLALTLLWNAIQEVRHAQGIGYGVPLVQLAATPYVALGSYRLWRADRRALIVTAVGLTLASLAGALAAWTYAPAAEQLRAGLGALGGGAVFTVAMLALARMSLKSPDPPASSAA